MVNDHMVIIPSEINWKLFSYIMVKLWGITSYFPVRAAILVEYEHDNVLMYHIPAEAHVWDPIWSSYSSHEDRMLDFRGHIVSCNNKGTNHNTCEICG